MRDSDGLLPTLRIEAEYLRFKTGCTIVEGVAPRSLTSLMRFELAQNLELGMKDINAGHVDKWLKAERLRMSWVDAGVTVLEPQQGIATSAQPLGIHVTQAEALRGLVLWPASGDAA
ncbi:hypothetical protein AB0O47_40375 [Streptomyces noursei]|uniref:hypothetical protein n=1 Tax=Streptomyces noursei TaxID=1971 RepID=UPI00344C3A48